LLDSYLEIILTFSIEAETRLKLEFNLTIGSCLENMILFLRKLVVVSQHEGEAVAGFHGALYTINQIFSFYQNSTARFIHDRRKGIRHFEK
jgi:hypothetical protein